MGNASVLTERYRGGSEKHTPYGIAAVLKNSPGDIFGKHFHSGQRLNELTRLIFSCRDLSFTSTKVLLSARPVKQLVWAPSNAAPTTAIPTKM